MQGVPHAVPVAGGGGGMIPMPPMPPSTSLQYMPPNMSALPHLHQRAPTPGRRTLASFFVSESLRHDLMRRNALIAARLDPEGVCPSFFCAVYALWLMCAHAHGVQIRGRASCRRR